MFGQQVGTVASDLPQLGNGRVQVVDLASGAMVAADASDTGRDELIGAAHSNIIEHLFEQYGGESQTSRHGVESSGREGWLCEQTDCRGRRLWITKEELADAAAATVTRIEHQPEVEVVPKGADPAQLLAPAAALRVARQIELAAHAEIGVHIRRARGLQADFVARAPLLLWVIS